MPNQPATTTINHYISNNDTATSLGYFSMNGTGEWSTALADVSINVETTKKSGIHPTLYFKYVKKKFGSLERMKLDSRLKKLEKAFYEAVNNGQEALGKKLLTEVIRETRESMMYAKGIRHFIERDDLVKFKNKIREGHISDTLFKEFTRIVPKDVLVKKEKVKELFDDFVIYHYWDEKAEANRQKKQKITPEEKSKLRDPILFGIIRETNRLYFIADWEDEHCDLTFEEMVDVLGKEDKEVSIDRNPKITV